MTAEIEHNNKRRRARQRGITLPELLISLMIFAMIASAGVYALRLAVEGREQLADADDRLRQWQVARAIVRDDLIHFVQRSTRDAEGVVARSAMVGGGGFYDRRPVAGETPLIGFTRRGWDNPDAAKPRSRLQYVEYALVGDALVRRVRIYLDAAPEVGANATSMREAVLIDNLQGAQFSFLAGQGVVGFQWTEDWPAPNAFAVAPAAVRLTTTSADIGVVEHYFWIGAVGQRVLEAA